MHQLEILLPFSIPPSPLAQDLARALHAPSLSMLLARAKAPYVHKIDDFSRALPHEILLAEPDSRLRSAPLTAADSSPADTPRKMQVLGLDAGAGYWFTLSPVHIHIARDHLVLTDSRRLELADAESRALYRSAQELCAESGKTLLYGDALTWFLRADDWSDMQTATPDAACGHNIDIWMAAGSQERAWRKLQNEIQMQWYSGPVNADRELRGLKPVNSVWLWGGNAPTPTPRPWQRGMQLPQQADTGAARQSRVLDALLEPALSSDWGNWLQGMQELETDCFAPLLKALQAGRLDQARLIVSDAVTLADFQITPWTLRKFWRKPTLSPLFALGTS